MVSCNCGRNVGFYKLSMRSKTLKNFIDICNIVGNFSGLVRSITQTELASTYCALIKTVKLRVLRFTGRGMGARGTERLPLT